MIHKTTKIPEVSSSLPLPRSSYLLQNIKTSISSSSLLEISSISLSESVIERYTHLSVNACLTNLNDINQFKLQTTNTTIEMPTRTKNTKTSTKLNSSKSSSINVINSTLKANLTNSSEKMSPKPVIRLCRSYSVPILKIDKASSAHINTINGTESGCDKMLTSLNRNRINCSKQLEQRKQTLFDDVIDDASVKMSSEATLTTKVKNTPNMATVAASAARLSLSNNGDNDVAFNDHNHIHQELRFGCAHYKRRAMFVTPCCNKFYKCRFCHDENESHHFDRKTLNELICSECNTRQKTQEACVNCGVRFGKYTCLICNLFDDEDRKQYHCDACGICRIGGAENFFHCEVCNMCLPIQLKIDGHKCVENISRSHCPVCLGDIHTSRIPCHIPDCGHLLHKMCFDQLLASGHYACPTCQTSLIDMTALWDFLDAQATYMPMPKKYEKEKIHIFCNDCQRTSKTYFHFIGLKCMECGAYNTTQDVKRRVSLVADEKNTA